MEPTLELTLEPTPEPTLEPTPEPTSKAYINSSKKSINISSTELTYILAFGILGISAIIVVVYIFYRNYPRTDKYAIENIASLDNKIEKGTYKETDEKNENSEEENNDLLNMIEVTF